MGIKIDIERCKGCRYCVLSCPKGLLKISDKFNIRGYHYAYIVDEESCNSCGFCFTICPDVAVEIKE